LLRSRKFWALMAALIATLAAFCTQQINVWQALQACIAALAVYSTGVAIEDSGNGSKLQS
jgi:hypothetical protein